MADWHKPFSSTYRFMRVSRQTGYETEQMDGILKGKLTINQDTATFESAELETARYFDIGSDFIRGYLDAEWEDGTTESVCLGTWLATIPSRSVDGASETCTAYCDGRLQELQDDSFEAPITVSASSNIVSTAKSIAVADGLAVIATPSSKMLDADWVFGLDDTAENEGGSKLGAVNALLGLANYSAASTDVMGNVIMQPYVEPAGRNPVWTFEEGLGATFLAKAVDERDSRDVCNVVLAIYETDEGTVIGSAVDDDPMSPFSTVSLNRRKVAKYTYNQNVDQATADKTAESLLRTQQAIIHRVTLSHVHCPARVGDVVTVKWPSAGIDGTYVIRTQSVDIGSAGCMTTSELKAYERRANG